MRYAQVRHMLDHVREFHGQLAEYYDQLSKTAERQRVKLLLDHMSSHEKQLQDSLNTYEEGAPRQVMDTWVDCKYCNDVLAACEQIPIAPEASLEEVIKATLDIDNCLLRFYREVAENVESERVREVFLNLIELEEGELRRLAFGALQVSDV